MSKYFKKLFIRETTHNLHNLLEDFCYGLFFEYFMHVYNVS